MHRALITGGSGLCGTILAQRLIETKDFTSVVLFDIFPPSNDPPLPSNITFRKGDLTKESSHPESIYQAIDEFKPTVVFHCGSFGMSGREQALLQRVRDVNIRGTRNVIDACLRLSVPRLVYTSTYNVVFGGQEIVNGGADQPDEPLPYFPPEKQVDEYSRSKTIADRLVLEKNGARLENGGTLKTICLRPAGIYGPGEMRHFPRVIQYMQRGIYSFTIGDPRSRVDWLHVENFAQAHILAERALRSPDAPAAGRGIMISDGKPINNFEFFRPLVEGLGYRQPTVQLSLGLMRHVAFVLECLVALLLRVPGGWTLLGLIPTLSRCEVNKCGVTHYFSMEPARRLIGYVPRAWPMDEVVEYYVRKGYRRKEAQGGRGGGAAAIVRAVFSMCLMGLALTWLALGRAEHASLMDLARRWHWKAP